MRLANRISLITFLTVAVAAGLVGTAAIETRTALLRRDFERSAVGVCEVLALSMASPLASSARHAEVQQIIDNVANYPDRHPDIDSLEVLDPDGVVVAHTNPIEYGRQRTTKRARQDLLRVAPFVGTVQGNRLRVVVPIRLAYPLGVLRGTFRLDRLDEAVREESALLVGTTILTAVLLALVMFVLLRRSVTRRIEALARQVSAFREQHSARVQIDGNDEVAELGARFNQMAAELERYTVNLERTVEERTSELKVANLRLEELAITDGLTGLHNHRFFQERLRRDVEIARRANRPLAIVMFDVDHFKAYNDTYGHPAGDEVLRRVAAALRDEARAADLVARYGGEEFVIAMPDADREAARAAAERIRRRVQREGVVTISGGIATFPEDAADTEELVARADRALYRAKSEGRDRITVSAEAAA